MATVGQTRATLDDLLRTPGKAELIKWRMGIKQRNKSTIRFTLAFSSDSG